MSESSTIINVNDEELSEEELTERLIAGTRIEKVTVSRTETRQKVQYHPNQYFLSVQLDFGTNWDLVDSIQDKKQQDTARVLLRKAIHRQVMDKENWISAQLYHMQWKDDVPRYLRSNNNPAVKAKSLTEAIQLANGQ